MKNLFKNLALCALVAGTFTACHSGGDSESESAPAPVVVTPTLQTTAKTIVVKLSSALPTGATVKYNGVNLSKVDNTTYQLDGVASGKKLELAGTGIVPQTINAVNFGERNVVAIELAVVNVETGTVIAYTPGTTTTSSASTDNTSIDQATGTATLPAGTNVTGTTDTNFSVTLFAPAQSPEGDVKDNQTIEKSPYALYCTPSGAKFDQPVTLSVALPEAVGADVKMSHETTPKTYIGTFSEGNLTAQVNHFSTWNIFLIGTIHVESTDNETLGTFDVKAGKNDIVYTEKFGYEGESAGIIGRTLKAIFGTTALPVQKTYTFESASAGTITIKQEKKNISFKSGNKTYTAVVYGKVSAETTSNTEEPIVPVVPTHNGGGSI